MPFELLGDSVLGLPFFIIMTFIFSLLVWSRFLKGGKLERPKDVYEMFDMISIFIFFLSILVFVIVVFLCIFNWLNLEVVTIDNLIEWVPLTVEIVIFFSIIEFIGFCNKNRTEINKNPKIELESLFFNIFFPYLCLLVFSLSLFFPLLLNTELVSIFLKYFPSMLIMVLISFFIPYFCIKNIFYGIKPKEVFSKRVIIVILICIISGSVLSQISIPKVKNTEMVEEYYYIDGSQLYIKSTIYLDVSFGSSGSIVPIIPINYGDYKFDVSSYEGRENFKLSVKDYDDSFKIIDNFRELENFNLKENKEIFTEIFFDNQTLFLRFNKYETREEIDKIILEGFSRQADSKLYSYNDNSRDSNICGNNRCMIIMNISNDLSRPIRQGIETVVNFNNENIENVSECKFIGVEHDFPLREEIGLYQGTCKGSWCELRIENIETDKNLVEIELTINENGVLKFQKFEISENVTINPIFYVEC